MHYKLKLAQEITMETSVKSESILLNPSIKKKPGNLDTA